MKRKFSILVIACLSLFLATNAFATTTFTDIGNSYAKTEIQALMLSLLNQKTPMLY